MMQNPGSGLMVSSFKFSIALENGKFLAEISLSLEISKIDTNEGQ